MSWEIMKIEKFAEVIGGGTPSTKKNEYWNGKIPWVTPKDLSNWTYKRLSKGERNITAEGLLKSSAKLLPPKTVLMTSRAPIGYLAIAQNEICTNQGFQSLVCDESMAEPEFIFYLLKANIDKIKNVASGATFPEISKTKLKQIEVNLPPLPTQKKIASILSAYDDLIENNLKRIQLLEEAAQRLYKEWFVDLKFPNHENTPINPKTGLPEGWEIRTLSDLTEKITDGTHDSPKPKESGFPLITGKNLKNGFIDFSNSYLISEDDHHKIQNRSSVNKEDILYSNIGTIGNTVIVGNESEFSCKNVIILKPLKQLSKFLYSFFTNEYHKSLFLTGLAGSNQKFISLKYIRNYEFYCPTIDLIKKFDSNVSNIFEQKYKLNEINQSLKEARDLLLPRLMNRTLEV